MLFTHYFQTGKLEVSEVRAGYVRGLWSGCVGFDRNVWNATIGGCQAALELAGAKQLETHVESGGGDGDASMIAIGTWK